MVDDDQGVWARARRNYRQATHGRRIVVLGLVAAAVFPVLGVMIGIVLLFRHRVAPGLGCIVLAVLAGAVYYLLEQVVLTAGGDPRSPRQAAAPPIHHQSVYGESAPRTRLADSLGSSTYRGSAPSPCPHVPPAAKAPDQWSASDELARL